MYSREIKVNLAYDNFAATAQYAINYLNLFKASNEAGVTEDFDKAIVMLHALVYLARDADFDVTSEVELNAWIASNQDRILNYINNPVAKED